MKNNSIRAEFKRMDYLGSADITANLFRLIFSWILLIGWFTFSFQVIPLAIYVPLSVMFCLIHQRELSEWIHEASHFNLHSNKTINDRLILVFAGFFFANDIKAHRFGHNEHHRTHQFFIETDPDTRLLKMSTRKNLWRSLVQDLIGFTAFKMFFDRTGARCPKPTTNFFIKLVVFQSVLILFLIYVSRLDIYIIYYFTLMTLYPVLNRLRLYGQHLELGKRASEIGKSTSSRTIDAGFLDRVFFTSKLMMYHYEHHQFPDLPFRALIEMPKHKDNENNFSRRRFSLYLDLYRQLS